MKFLRPALALAVSLSMFGAAHAQIAAYAAFTGAHYDTPDKFYGGGTFGIYDDFYKFGPLHLGADVRGTKLSGSDHNSSTSVLAGFRAAVKPPVLPIKPYAEILAGVASTDIGTVGGSKHLSAEANGGIDFTFLPHLDWRAVEIGGQIGGDKANSNLHVSTGLVLRFF
jgi:hypothetical protein